MVDKINQEIVQQLKDKGLSCAKLKSKINDSLKDAQDFRKLGLLKAANAEESVASHLKEIKRRVCLLP